MYFLWSFKKPKVIPTSTESYFLVHVLFLKKRMTNRLKKVYLAFCHQRYSTGCKTCIDQLADVNNGCEIILP